MKEKGLNISRREFRDSQKAEKEKNKIKWEIIKKKKEITDNLSEGKKQDTEMAALKEYMKQNKVSMAALNSEDITPGIYK